MDKKRFAWIIKAIDFEKLNDWETTFLESLECQVKKGRELTETQEEILERIFGQKQ